MYLSLTIVYYQTEWTEDIFSYKKSPNVCAYMYLKSLIDV